MMNKNTDKQPIRQPNDAAIGKNRTGIALSPIDKQDLLEVTGLTVPSMDGDETDLAEARAEYIEEGVTIGSMPPPASVKGIAQTGVGALKGVNAAVILDKIGARLAFERTGVRLYGALIDKCEATAALDAGPTVGDLQEIQADELAHFELLREAMLSLGGDPTAITPSADVQAVASTGLLQVITDARTTLKQSLEAMLIVELADNDSWMLLIDLVRAAGHEDLAVRFEEARANENSHVMKVRSWVKSAITMAAKPSAQVRQ